ncbi:hypothetical protein [Alteribacter aurantiacus]|uniref:hypothetical protein n=1 Tax=Alteribacter aurantiacus TaxID=254410 RepID=UPI000411CDA7|nr:hypothetical protein [Alteribacter aurantiacus]
MMNISRVGTGLVAGVIILLAGLFLNAVLLTDMVLVLFLTSILAVFVANKLGKNAFIGILAYLIFYVAVVTYTRSFGDPEELLKIVELLIYQGLATILTTFVLAILIK